MEEPEIEANEHTSLVARIAGTVLLAIFAIPFGHEGARRFFDGEYLTSAIAFVIAVALAVAAIVWAASKPRARFAHIATDPRWWVAILLMILAYFGVSNLRTGTSDEGLSLIGPREIFSLIDAMRPDNDGQKHWAVAVTAPAKNRWIKEFMESAIERVARDLHSGPLDQNQNAILSIRTLPLPGSLDRDTPFPRTGDTDTILLHGDRALTLKWARVLQDCFKVQRTESGLEPIETFYRSRRALNTTEGIIWIEIGNGSPWAHAQKCSDGPPINPMMQPRLE